MRRQRISQIRGCSSRGLTMYTVSKLASLICHSLLCIGCLCAADFRFGTQQGRRGFAPLQLPILEVRRSLYWYMMWLTGRRSHQFGIGWSKSKWYAYVYVPCCLLILFWMFNCAFFLLYLIDIIVVQWMVQHAEVDVNLILIGNKCDLEEQRVSVLNAFSRYNARTSSTFLRSKVPLHP